MIKIIGSVLARRNGVMVYGRDGVVAGRTRAIRLVRDSPVLCHPARVLTCVGVYMLDPVCACGRVRVRVCACIFVPTCSLTRNALFVEDSHVAVTLKSGLHPRKCASACPRPNRARLESYTPYLFLPRVSQMATVTKVYDILRTACNPRG